MTGIKWHWPDEKGIKDKTVSPQKGLDCNKSSSLPVDGGAMDFEEIDLTGAESPRPIDNVNGANELEYENDEEGEIPGQFLNCKELLQDEDTDASPDELIMEVGYHGSDDEYASQLDKPDLDETVLINNTSITSCASEMDSDMMTTSSSSSEETASKTAGQNRNATATSCISKPCSNPNQSSSFSCADRTAFFVENLEHQVNELNQLLVSKEKEWNALLTLKNHAQNSLAIVQSKCIRSISELEESHNGPMSPTDTNACLIVADKEKMENAKRKIEESIKNTESEQESLQSKLLKFQNTTKDERKRKVSNELSPGHASKSKLRISDVRSIAPQTIQIHQTETGGKQKIGETGNFASSLNMSPERQYVKTLKALMAMAEADKQQEHTSVVATSSRLSTLLQENRSIAPEPINKIGQQPRKSPLLANPIPSSSATSALPTYSINPQIEEFLLNADTNSASATCPKVDPKRNVLKSNKERDARENDPSQVPSNANDLQNVPLCQGCNLTRAQFVCAECCSRWYCSRECQVADWDEHSEMCSG